ncbi:MAG: HisA/HisF-related TIM barrel protein, partial [Dermabacter sp.]|nr:HisA/HisF-related TIM barrel protein [Dermabacter sp.]
DSPDALTTALATGCARVNLSASALADRGFVREAIHAHAERLAVCVDVRGTLVHPRGSEDPIGELTDILAFLNDAGCARLIVTEIDRDGALSGPPLALLESVSGATDAELIASGGIADLKDIEELVRLAGHTRVAGAIVGRALLEGRFGLAEALACVQRAENEGAEQPSERKK